LRLCIPILLVALSLFLAPSSHAQRASDGERTSPVRDASYSATESTDDAETRTPTLVERYQQARLRMLAERMQGNDQGRVSPAPTVRMTTASDSLHPSLDPQVAPPEEPTFSIHHARSLRKLERGWFKQEFADTRWSFLGAGRYFSPFDTTMTRDLRGRLQTVFGNPTQTLGDFDLRKPLDEYVQFEYWLVVNDSIPVKVTDANGALDRGLIVSTPAEYRGQLRELRNQLLSPIMDAEPAPYVDYYFESETRRWYRTGYDGESYFLDRVYRYEMTPERRPWLDTDSVSSREPRVGDS